MEAEDNNSKTNTENLDSKQQFEESQPKETSTVKPKTKLPVLLLGLVFVITALVGIFLYINDQDNTITNPTSVTNQENKPEESNYISYTYISSLLHQTTVEFEHPKTWEVKVTETEFGEGVKLKSMVIGSERGNYLHIYDRDGIGGYCEPNNDTYTVSKILTTRSEDVFFKDFSVPSLPELDGKLLLEVIGRDWSDPMHEALNELESSTDTCKLPVYSTVGGSGVTISIRDTENINAENSRWLGWEDIKDDEEFVAVIQSIKANDKSER